MLLLLVVNVNSRQLFRLLWLKANNCDDTGTKAHRTVRCATSWGSTRPNEREIEASHFYSLFYFYHLLLLNLQVVSSTMTLFICFSIRPNGLSSRARITGYERCWGSNQLLPFYERASALTKLDFGHAYDGVTILADALTASSMWYRNRSTLHGPDAGWTCCRQWLW